MGYPRPGWLWRRRCLVLEVIRWVPLGVGEDALPTAMGLARSTLLPSTIYILCAEVLIATLTAERLVGCFTGGSKEKALPDDPDEVGVQELKIETPAVTATAARIFNRYFIGYLDLRDDSSLHILAAQATIASNYYATDVNRTQIRKH